MRARRAPAWVLAVLSLALAIALSLMIGARYVEPGTVWQVIFGGDRSSPDTAVVLSRVPRTLTGLVAGAALATSGLALQALSRNDLADPGILGVTSGAALAVAAGGVIGAASTMPAVLAWALFGGLLSAVLVHVLARLAGSTAVALVLAGVALSAGLGSLTTALLLISRASLDSFRFWQVGSLTGRGVDDLMVVLPLVVLGVVMILVQGRALDALALGDDVARAQGVRVGRTMTVVAGGAVVLAAAATALAGPIGLVGLIVPHAVRLLTGWQNLRARAVLTLLVGPTLVLVADTLGRVLAPPGEVQVGVLTSALGAMVFLALVIGRAVRL